MLSLHESKSKKVTHRFYVTSAQAVEAMGLKRGSGLQEITKSMDISQLYIPLFAQTLFRGQASAQWY